MLSGLSAAQHKWELKAAADDGGDGGPEAREWVVSPYVDDVQVFDEEDRVATLHPVYAIPQDKADEIQDYFASRPGF